MKCLANLQSGYSTHIKTETKYKCQVQFLYKISHQYKNVNIRNVGRLKPCDHDNKHQVGKIYKEKIMTGFRIIS